MTGPKSKPKQNGGKKSGGKKSGGNGGKSVKGGMTAEETRYHERLLREERRRAFQEGLDLAIAMSADPKELVAAVKDLAKADAAVIMSGRKTGYIIRPGYLWGERKLIDDKTEDKFEATFPILRHLENLKVAVTPHFHGSVYAFADHMHVYKNKTPRGRTFRHIKVATLDKEYQQQFKASLKKLPDVADPDRTFVDGPVEKPKPKPKTKKATVKKTKKSHT